MKTFLKQEEMSLLILINLVKWKITNMVNFRIEYIKIMHYRTWFFSVSSLSMVWYLAMT